MYHKQRNKKIRRRNPLQAFLHSVTGLLMILLAFFATISLVSFDTHDESFNHVTGNVVKNWGGKIGAYTADALLQLFGFSVIFIVLILLIWGLWLLRLKKLDLFIIRFLSSVLLIVTACELLSNIPATKSLMLASCGGIVGYLTHNVLHNILPYYLYIASLLILFFTSFSFCFSSDLSDWRSVLWTVMKPYWIAGRTTYMLLRGFVILFRDDNKVKKEDIKQPKVINNKIDERIKININEQVKDEPKTKHITPDLGNYTLPSTELLTSHDISKHKNISKDKLEETVQRLESVLQDYGIDGRIIQVSAGPVVILYELEPAPGIKSSRIIGLADDIARSMSATAARIAVIPGRNVIGIELPNPYRETVYLREILESTAYRESGYDLPIVLGKGIGGEPIVVDLAKMPHLLVAGTTGSGKSVAINTMIMSLLYRHDPSRCKFIMIDPKMLELSVYDGIPHLLTSVVTEPGKAVIALKWIVKEMENRYRSMSKINVRNITTYNERVTQAKKTGEVLLKSNDPNNPAPELETLPLIVVIVDEMADLMIVAGKDIETSVQRLAQMARAAGIHIIMATQRPSVDVITGVIKANFPTRISFQVTSRIDSRTILGDQGAEQLLGMGDMLYMAGGGRITRVHGPFVSDKEVDKIVSFIRTQGTPDYIDNITESDEGDTGAGFSGEGGGDLYSQAVTIVRRDRKASTSYLQRCLKIGYNRAADLIDRMEREGIITQANHVGKRDVID